MLLEPAGDTRVFGEALRARSRRTHEDFGFGIRRGNQVPVMKWKANPKTSGIKPT